MSLSPFENCRLCPRLCGADRAHGKTGVCGETDALRIAYAGLHRGEEPPISSRRGSGAFFFAGCPCHCCHCQNWQISSLPADNGAVRVRTFSDTEFLAAARSLVSRGAANLNFVTPEHVWPHVSRLLAALRAEGTALPAVWNSSGYVRAELVGDYAKQIDIFLPDCKFDSPGLARLVMGDADYPALALAAIERMVEAKGFLRPFDEMGRTPAKEGVMVRHLVLPGHAADSIAVLTRLHAHFGPGLPLSVMSQYTPVPATERMPPFDRRLAREEYDLVLDAVERLGFEHVFIQPMEDDSSRDPFLPDFRAENPFS